MYVLRFGACTANLRTNIMGFRGFDSSTILILRGGILASVGILPEFLRQAILASRDNATVGGNYSA